MIGSCVSLVEKRYITLYNPQVNFPDSADYISVLHDAQLLLNKQQEIYYLMTFFEQYRYGSLQVDSKRSSLQPGLRVGGHLASTP